MSRGNAARRRRDDGHAASAGSFGVAVAARVTMGTSRARASAWRTPGSGTS